MEHKLKLDTFRRIYKRLKTPFPPVNYLILGWLMGIEFQYIELRTKQTVDEAINDFMEEHSPEVTKAAVKQDKDGNFYIGDID